MDSGRGVWLTAGCAVGFVYWFTLQTMYRIGALRRYCAVARAAPLVLLSLV
ncbi:hypothetical protein [Nocardia sp. NPDC051463]|uniref:hypothetical protein n=1 Tax=Nocardia sp. NPDC051463 TaxID=3154845 RepID=UPI0034461B85